MSFAAVVILDTLQSFAERAVAQEEMDDLSIDGPHLQDALRDLRFINRLLGGYRCLRLALMPLLIRRAGSALTILDLGAGGADYAEQILSWGRRHRVEIRIVAVDANAAIVRYAVDELNGRVAPPLRDRIEVVQGNALDLPYDDGSFDVVTASLFMHHLSNPDCVRLLCEMDRIATEGIIVNDLYRHPLAWAGFRTLSAALRLSPMVRHDGAVSVRRGFHPGELVALARAAELTSARIGRRWAFRIYMTTL